MTLNAFIAKTGFCSRRKAAELVKEGRVGVNGRTVKEPWIRVESADKVTVNGKSIATAEKERYIIFNKPKGVTTTLEDKFASRKVTDFIPEEFGRVYPVGRLDKGSRGLIILTNDGTLCYHITHPKFEVEKEYIATVKGTADHSIIEKLKRGLRDGEDMLKVKSAAIEFSSSSKTKIRLVVCEGKKRHLRRLFARLGFPVTDLNRIRIGGLQLGNLREGSFKTVTREYIYNIFLKRDY